MKISKSFFLLVTVSFSFILATAQTNRFSANRYLNSKGDTLNYRLLIPDADTLRKYPLVIFLHGSGERGNDNEAQLKWGVLNFASDQMMMSHPAIVVAPQCPSNMGCITGLSMGGFGTYDAIERYPNLFAAAMPVCGGGDISRAASIAHIPIWNFHGAEDPAVDPRLSAGMLDALMKAGAHPGFTFYPESGHFSWLAAYSDPLAIEWLFRQRKKGGR
jgi:predicted peptidase